MAKDENKKSDKKDETANAGSGAAETNTNANTQDAATTAGEKKPGDDTDAVSGKDKSFDESFDFKKSLGKLAPRVGMPVMFLPSIGDEVCRHNGATVNFAICTAVFEGNKINLQAIPDGGAMQWRTTIDHVSNAAEGADAWCHLHEHESFNDVPGIKP